MVNSHWIVLVPACSRSDQQQLDTATAVADLMRQSKAELNDLIWHELVAIAVRAKGLAGGRAMLECKGSKSYPDGILIGDVFLLFVCCASFCCFVCLFVVPCWSL